MNARIETALIIIGVILGSLVWIKEYAQPKSATLDAAASCMYDQGLTQDASARSKAAWKVCLKEAEKAHATPLLLTLGY